MSNRSRASSDIVARSFFILASWKEVSASFNNSGMGNVQL
jgi:hypothetical protein